MRVRHRKGALLSGGLCALLIVLLVVALRLDRGSDDFRAQRLSVAPPSPVATSIGASAPAPAAARDAGPAPAAGDTVGPVQSVGLIIPVQGVEASDLVDTYSKARGQGRRHDAIDIIAPRGTPVLAVAEGKILALFLSDAGGITLYQLATDRRTIYYYAHLDRYAPGIAEGGQLRQSEVLGYVGDTGNAAPGNHHLHFAISMSSDPSRYWDGTPQNPYPLLTGETGRTAHTSGAHQSPAARRHP